MQTINEAYVREVMAMVNNAPFPSHMPFRLVGMDFDRARVEMDAAGQHLQPFGIVHGGVIATLIDTATFWAGFMRLPADAGLVNVDLKLNYLKAVMPGALVAEGRCIRAGHSISYTEAYVRDAAGEIVAHGTSSLMALPGKGLKIQAAKFLD
jgi:uncharacterized protein (TIGR00369 family)